MDNQKTQELLNLVKNNYQTIAAEFSITRKKEIWPEIREFAKKINNGDSVLDLGCGNGRLNEALTAKEINYLGVDNSLELIKLAKLNYPDKKFIFGDILDLNNIANDCYDHIFCLATLQHIPSKELRLKALEQMAIKLNKDGEMVISNWNLWGNKKYRGQLIKNYWLKITGRNNLDYNDLLFPWKNKDGREMSTRYYHAFTKKELKKLSRLANLKILELRRDKYNFWLILKRK